MSRYASCPFVPPVIIVCVVENIQICIMFIGLSCPLLPLIIVSIVENQARILWRVARSSLRPNQLEMAHGMELFVSHALSLVPFSWSCTHVLVGARLSCPCTLMLCS